MSVDPFRVPDDLLAACAAEPIHIPGAVQSHGLVLVIDPDLQIEQAGGAALLGVGPEELPGRPLADLVPTSLVDAVRAAIATARGARDLGTFELAGGTVEASLHRCNGVLILELFTAGVCAAGIGTAAEAASIVAGILDACTRRDDWDVGFETLTAEVAETFRNFSGYDRVMVYRFDAAWNGEVIAEACEGDPRFAGLWFPSSDIPPQARDLYTRARLRVLADASSEPLPLHPAQHPRTGGPLDLSLALLRALSPVHREYLGHMGVRGTLVASIVVRGRLWGLLSCHHDEPRVPDGPTRVLALGLAAAIATLVQAHEQRQRELGSQWAQALLATLRSRVLSAADLSESIVAPDARFLEVVAADGMAVCTPAGLRTRGRLPPLDAVTRLVDWLDEHVEVFFVSNHLGVDIPELTPDPLAAGVMALRIPGFRRGWVIWSRTESQRTVHWGGDPRKGIVGAPGAQRLSPRTSFEAWLETVQGQSRPWSTAERAMVSEAVRTNLLDVVVAWQRRQADAMEARYSSLLAKVHDAIIVLDPHGRVTFWNEGATEILGWSAEERLGALLVDCMPAALLPDLRRRSSGVVEGGRVAAEVEVTRRDGTPVWLDVQADCVADDEGAAPAYVIIARDATRRRELETQLRQATKMEAVGALAGGIAHDFNNLLTVVTGFSSLVLKSLPHDAPERWMVQEIAGVGQRGTALTQQMLAFGRRQLLQPETFDLNEAVQACARMLERLIGEDVRLVLDLADGGCAVHVDRGQLDQVMLNLAVNARDAMPSGGQVTFATRIVHHEGGAVPGLAVLPEGAYACLSVQDTGIGMTADVLAKIFEPFFTTKEPGRGTGLGLAVVYGVVNQSKGFVGVDSAPGRGTTCRVYLPLTHAGLAEAPVMVEAHAPAAHGETVLVVEDEPGVRSLTCLLLRQHGYHVIEASHPLEALELARQLARIDLLVTDVVMPEMHGPDVAMHLAERMPDLRVLFMSGYPGDEMVRRGLVADGEFLRKPFSPAVLLARVRAVLDGRSPAVN